MSPYINKDGQTFKVEVPPHDGWIKPGGPKVYSTYESAQMNMSIDSRPMQRPSIHSMSKTELEKEDKKSSKTKNGSSKGGCLGVLACISFTSAFMVYLL